MEVDARLEELVLRAIRKELPIFPKGRAKRISNQLIREMEAAGLQVVRAEARP